MGEPFKVTAVPPPSVLYNPLAWLLWLLDLLIWVITLVGPVKWGLSFFNPEATTRTKDGAWRMIENKEELATTMYPECTTVHDLVQRSFAVYANRDALGTRRYIGEDKPEWSKIPLRKYGETDWLTFRDMGKAVGNFGAGLLKLGMKPAPDGADLQTAAGPHTLVIFEETCAAWMIACLGAFSRSIAVATSYSTLGMGAVAEAVNETRAKAIVCNVKEAKKVAEYCGGKCPSLETIIYTLNNSVAGSQPEVPAKCPFKMVSVNEVIEMGAAGGAELKASPPTPEHLGVVMYTSGSTGKPKGVMIKHRSLVASIAALGAKFQHYTLKPGEETYLAYLPAAHILELVAEISMVCLGASIGFACPRTISSKGACRLRPDGTTNYKPGYPHPPGGLQEFRPTCMAAVPKIWDILMKGVIEVLDKSGPVSKFLFQAAYSGRYWATLHGRESPLFKALVFKKLSDMLGGRMKVGVTGGGPISAEVQGFIRTAFAMPLVQGYALTETCCAGTAQLYDDTRFGVVGPPLGSVEIKVRSCVGSDGEPEVLDRKGRPYLDTDEDHYGQPCVGRGEVLIRGPSVSSGYFKQPEKTAEVFDKDGWFHTGDVGLINPDGSLMIVDRLKNLVKLKGGEYIAIEAMEKEYATSPFTNGIHGGILCYGDGEMDRPVALVQCNTVELEKWARESGVEYKTVDQLCGLPAAEKVVLDSMVAIGKAGALGANEILCGVGLLAGTGPMEGNLELHSPWMPENGGLTASNKLNRNKIQETCSPLLAPLRKKAAR